jgi:hypothetical protein
MTEPWKLTNEMVLQTGASSTFTKTGQYVPAKNPTPNAAVFYEENLAGWIDMGDHYLTGREGDLTKVSKPDEPARKAAWQRSSVEIGDSLWFPLPTGRSPAKEQDRNWSGQARGVGRLATTSQR